MNLGWSYLRLALYIFLLIVFFVVFDALLNPIQTDQLLHAYWDTSVFDSFDEITAIGLSESEHFLLLDDDFRHDGHGGHNDQDATNGPTVLGYTKIPSPPPSSSPFLDPCKGYDGTFGNTASSNKITISFMYGVESNMTLVELMPVSLSDQIKEIDQALLDLLIESSFDHCILDAGSRNINIFEEEG